MKAPLLSFTACASLVGLFSSLTLTMSGQDVRRSQPVAPTRPTTVAPADSAGVTTPDLSRGVYLASIDVEDRSLRRYAGQTMFNTEGAELGAVRDFIVHPATSSVRYVVVSSGGVLGGIGNSLRLVPFESLRRSTRANTFEVDILQSAWLQVPPISDEHYVIDRFEISPVQHQQMVERYGSNAQVARPVTTTASQGGETGLIRASTLRGRPVNAVDRKVGDIENIIIDLERGTAAALLDSSGAFTGTTAKYLIPLSGLTFAHPRQDALGTTLTRADFDRAVPFSFAPAPAIASAPARVVEERPLSPTGRTDTVVPAPRRTDTVPAPRRVETVPTPARSSDTLTASAHAVRQAIDSDPALAAERVQVMAENGRIILTGTVRSQILKQNLENVARRALPAGSIENRVTVVNR